jgi:hypothetical protein
MTKETDSVSPVRELKPCPFCGGEAARNTDTEEEIFTEEWISCMGCGATTTVEFWNRRSLDTADGVEPDAYKWRWLYTEGRVGSWSTCLAAREARPLTDESAGMEVVPLFASRTPNTEMVVKALDGARDLVDAWCVRYVNGMPPSTARDKLITDILALASPPSPAESDMALVPRIETDAMCEAGLEALRENLGHSAVIMRDAAACYRAMVTASLQPNKKG